MAPEINNNLSERELYLKVKKLIYLEQAGYHYAEKSLSEYKKLSQKINSDFYKNAVDDYIYFDNNNEYSGNISNISNTKYLENQKLQSIIDYLFAQDEENTNEETIQALNLNNGNYSLCIVSGDSMVGVNILPGCELLIDKSLIPVDKQIIVTEVNSEFFVKRIRFIENEIWLLSENPNYKPYKIKSNDEFKIYGVVTKILLNPV